MNQMNVTIIKTTLTMIAGTLLYSQTAIYRPAYRTYLMRIRTPAFSLSTIADEQRMLKSHLAYFDSCIR